MRIAVSNIAWELPEDEGIATLLGNYGVDAIDIAPGKYFPKPAEATPEQMQRVRAWWQARNIEITGMQALLFGTSGLNVFGPKESQSALVDHLAAVCRIAQGVGATRLVFGSPKNRDRSGLDDARAKAEAVDFFRRVGEIAGSYGVLICLEPNPPRYGANFMLNSQETADVVAAVAHPAIRMQLDTGALTINGEDARQVASTYAPFVGHVHASEPDLVPLGDGPTDHERVAAAVREFLPSQVVSIEMVATKNEPHLESIERALRVALRWYADTTPPGAAA